MKTKTYLLVLMAILTFSCSKDDGEDQLVEQFDYLEINSSEFSKITEKIKEEIEILDESLKKEDFESINKIIEEYSNNKIVDRDFKSMLMIYNEALKEKDDETRLKYYLKNYSNFLDYDKQLDLVVLKIIPEEAALLSSKGLIKMDEKIIQLSFESKKTIENGDDNLIATLSEITKSTKNITVEYFEKEFVLGDNQQKIKHTWRIEVEYPLSYPRRGKYHIIGTNMIILHIFRGIFIREYTYHVQGHIQPFYNYDPITAPSIRCRASYQHTANDSDFSVKYGSSSFGNYSNLHVIRTPRGRIHLRRLRKKLDIADDLTVTSHFKITYPDGYVFESSFSNDKPKTDDIPIFD